MLEEYLQLSSQSGPCLTCAVKEAEVFLLIILRLKQGQGYDRLLDCRDTIYVALQHIQQILMQKVCLVLLQFRAIEDQAQQDEVFTAVGWLVLQKLLFVLSEYHKMDRVHRGITAENILLEVLGASASRSCCARFILYSQCCLSKSLPRVHYALIQSDCYAWVTW
jgi:hypothetical protein